ncbi:osmotically inducible protein OsmC [Alkalilimnicola ehrlichii]|uniref:Osmotically inducible protein OsmC n=1 Tax=Alkalilimnicola ehrlichii TaxID=351052 RepID=A0A3E0WKH9_9GAMM|nr:OsmC family protein [Alkalilimnicola ehrlichii]RFA26400.1 osmotically inducible protein OsmC [Alkalilimnicola ehrlichii]RFA33462.1 osmotically inducible protein OsmC [Alkalilimnicola ehrlichii]
MQGFPHQYQARALARLDGSVPVESTDLDTLETTAPPEFDGPAGYWSPETMLTGAVASCFVLSFRAVAQASKFHWEQLTVEVEAVLDQVDKVTRFTHFTVKPCLTVADGTDTERAKVLLEKAERVCLVNNSLSAEITLVPNVVIA